MAKSEDLNKAAQDELPHVDLRFLQFQLFHFGAKSVETKYSATASSKHEAAGLMRSNKCL